MRGRRPLAPDRLRLLVAQALDDAVGDGVELALGAARADDEVVGQGGQRGRSSSTMSAAFLSSASSTIRRASSSGSRCLLGRLRVPLAWAGRRLAARSRASGGGVASVTVDGVLRWVSVQRMVLDIGRDRIRDEVAQRSPGRGAPRRSDADSRRRGAVEERRPGRRCSGSWRARNAGRGASGSRRAARRRSRASSRTRRGSRQVGSPTNASADTMSTRSSGARPPRSLGTERLSVSTVYDGPARSSSHAARPRSAGLPAIASSTIASRSLGRRRRPGPACAAARRPG